MEAVSSWFAGVRVKHFEEKKFILGHLGIVVPSVLSGIGAVQQILRYSVVRSIFLKL